MLLLLLVAVKQKTGQQCSLRVDMRPGSDWVVLATD